MGAKLILLDYIVNLSRTERIDDVTLITRRSSEYRRFSERAKNAGLSSVNWLLAGVPSSRPHGLSEKR